MSPFVIVDVLDNVVGPFATREEAQTFLDESTDHERRSVNDWIIDGEIHELQDPDRLLLRYRELNGPLGG